MLQEQQTRIQNWLWMVHGHRQGISCKGMRKYIPEISIEQQPRFCYIHLFRKEICDMINWPWYPTLHEVCSWDPELWDEGVQLYHFHPGGNINWKELEEINKSMGHILAEVEQLSFADVAQSMAGHRITCQCAQEWFNTDWLKRSTEEQS